MISEFIQFWDFCISGLYVISFFFLSIRKNIDTEKLLIERENCKNQARYTNISEL